VAWYEDESRLSYVATFDNSKKASDEANRAARKGWMPQGTAATDGHVNVGRTTLKVLTLGLPFLITGASRSKGKVTLTFVRTPEWLSVRQARDVARQRAAEAGEQTKRELDVTRRAADIQRKAMQRHTPSVAVPATWTVGHLTAETMWYSKPDILATPAGTLPLGMRVEIRSTRGKFAWVQPASGPTCWIARAAITDGLPHNDAPPNAVAAKPSVGEPPMVVSRAASPAVERSEPSPDNATERSASVPSSDLEARTKTRFCGRCGEKLAHEDDRFCQSCGAAL
jgi:hypothetical protein